MRLPGSPPAWSCRSMLPLRSAAECSQSSPAHSRLLPYQFVSSQLVQNLPGTPPAGNVTGTMRPSRFLSCPNDLLAERSRSPRISETVTHVASPKHRFHLEAVAWVLPVVETDRDEGAEKGAKTLLQNLRRVSMGYRTDLCFFLRSPCLWLGDAPKPQFRQSCRWSGAE